MFFVLVVTTALVAPIAVGGGAPSHNPLCGGVFGPFFWGAPGSHVETWRLISNYNLTFIVVSFKFLLVVYEVIVTPAIFVLLLENKDKHHRENTTN